MKLYTSDKTELMEVTEIKSEDSKLVIVGNIMGAMPIEAILTGTELRKIFPLLSVRVVFTAIRLLFSK